MKITVQSRNPNAFYTAMPHLRGEESLCFWQGELPDLKPADIAGVTHIIQAANYPNTGQKNYALNHARYAVDGSRAVQNLAEANPVKSVLLISSGGAYRAEPVALTEVQQTSDNHLKELQNSAEDNLKEPTVYGVTKRFLEVCWTAWGTANNIRVPIARCFSLIGTHMPLENSQAIGNFMADALAGRDIIIKGDGTAMRTYMYGTDLVIWLLALLNRGRHGIPYNVGSEEPVSIKELAETIAAIVNPKIKVKTLGKPTEGNAPGCYIPDTSRIREELGLKIGVKLSEAVTRCKDSVPE